MTGMLLAHPWSLWISLGGVLLIAEMLGANGYLLWSGVAAVATGLLSAILPLNLEAQGICFALLTLAAAWGWWRWLNGQKHRESASGWSPNQRGKDLVGQTFVLDSPLNGGRGNLRLADSSWPVIAERDLAAGTRVVVIAVEGITLRVRPLD